MESAGSPFAWWVFTNSAELSLISDFKLADTNFLSLLYLTDHNFKEAEVS